jgi:hypothetical protein
VRWHRSGENRRSKVNIRDQQDELKILRMLISYGRGSGEALIYTTQDLVKFGGLEKNRARSAADRLEQLGQITIYKGGYLVTSDGQQRYDEAVQNNKLPISGRAWTIEARSGMKPNGDPTDIKNAAIPGPEIRPLPETPEEIVGRIEAANKTRKRIAASLKLDIKKFDELFRDGLITLCNGQNTSPHIGRFHRKGDRLQHLCTECMKLYVKERKGQ